MTLSEAKEKISRELMNGFVEWIRDWDVLSDYDFGRKYYYGKRKVKPKFNFESLKGYMNDEFNGMWLPHWVKEGYPREIIYQLHREAWLSYQEYSNWRARNTGHTDFYYISQRTAKEIWKEYKTQIMP